MSNAIGFKKATKQAAKLRLALMGPPGSGKTYTGLVVATALGGRIAVIDTEKGSASKYADLFSFDVLELEGSFHPKRYVEAIHAAEQAGYTSLVIDSLSHAWIGEEGGLDLHDKAVARQKTKNSFTAWGEVTPHHNALVQSLIQSRCHIIATMRTKVEYAQEKDASGRTNIRKIGTAPLMRDGVEYEFDVVGDLDTENVLVVTKTRCPDLRAKAFPQPAQNFTKPLIAWLGGNPPTAQEERRTAPPPEEKPNGKQEGKPGGITGPALLKRLQDKDVALAKAGRCQPGDLVRFITQAGRSQGFPADIAEWDERGFHLAVDQTKQFEERTEGKGHTPRKASKKTLMLLDAQLARLPATAAQKQKYLADYGANSTPDLSEEQAQELTTILREEFEARVPSREPGDDPDNLE